MGWYTALALSGAISFESGYHLIDTMGAMMKDELVGSQMIYPIMKDNWQRDKAIHELVLSEIRQEFFDEIRALAHHLLHLGISDGIVVQFDRSHLFLLELSPLSRKLFDLVRLQKNLR